MKNYQEVTKHYADKKAQPKSFEIGEKVFVEDVKGQSKWLTATITKKIGSIMYRVQVNNESWRRHADQIRVRKAELTADPTADYSNDDDFEIQKSQVVERNLPAADTSPIAMPTEESNSKITCGARAAGQ